MTEENPYKIAVKAIALGESDAGRLSKPLMQDDPERFALYVTAVFAGCVERQFREDRSQGAIDEFMRQLRYSFRNANPPLKPLATEALIKALWDEDHPIDEISLRDQQLSQLAVIRKIVDDSEEVKADLDAYLNDAELMVRSWIDEFEKEEGSASSY